MIQRADKTTADVLQDIAGKTQFYHNEIARLETNFIAILLPAALTAISLKLNEPGAVLSLAGILGILGFFITYLVLLLVDLVSAEKVAHTLKQLRTLVVKNYQDGSVRLEFALSSTDLNEVNRLYGIVGSHRYAMPSGKPLIAALAGLAIWIILTVSLNAHHQEKAHERTGLHKRVPPDEKRQPGVAAGPVYGPDNCPP